MIRFVVTLINMFMKVVKRTTSEFIELANAVHSNKYDYSASEYIKGSDKIKIICAEHGMFEQRAYKHLQGSGCKTCNRTKKSNEQRKTTTDFINQAAAVHDNFYDYSCVNYTRCDVKVEIVCPNHGIFVQEPKSHLAGCGCPKCSKRISQGEKQWLDYMNVPNSKRCRQVTIFVDNGAKVQVDGFDPNTNTVYEFWGDYWHGNPEVYAPEEINATNKIPFGTLYEETLKKKSAMQSSGYVVVDMWESEWKILRERLNQQEK